MARQGSQRAAGAKPRQPHQMHETQQAISSLVKAITAEGVQLDTGLINTTAQASAACAMLVRLGLCSAEQMDTLVLSAVRDVLAHVLQQIEQAKLEQKQTATGLQVVQRPEIVIAKH